MDVIVSVPFRSKTSPQCASSVSSIPGNFAWICAPVSFWNFCSAAAVGWNANTPSNAVAAAASCFFVVLLIVPIALVMTTDALPGNAHRSSAGAGPQRCGPAVKPFGRRSALRARRLVEGGAQSLGKLHGVVIGPEVQEE